MDANQLTRAFIATVQASLHGLKALEALLVREQLALSGKDPELLQQIVREKLALLKELSSSVQARDRLQKAAGVAEGLEGGARLVAQLDQAALTDDWARLTGLARSIAEHNQRNGQLAMQGQRATRTALGILTGRPTSEDTYTGLRRRNGGAARYTLGKV